MDLTQPLPAIGAQIEGGYFAGLININGQRFGLVVAARDGGEAVDQAWLGEYREVPGATSVFDGLANTRALADAGSDLAKWATGLQLAGFSDWYLPSRDELEVVFRAFKPTAAENYAFGRHGENVSAVPPTYAHTATEPAQTAIEAFKDDGAEAFNPDDYYWSSTQSSRYLAWAQLFADGYRYDDSKGNEFRARAVRRFVL